MTQIAEIDDEAWNAATREFLKARDEEAKMECRFRIIIWAIAALGALGAIIVWSAQPARAEPICMQWPAMKAFLAKRYGEVPAGGGQINGTAVAQVLTSPDGSSWTIVIVNANGQSCALTAGKNWEPVRVEGKGEEPT